MALILDKTVTGATSLDVSGNTISTGYTNLYYTDQHGIIHENPYLVIDNMFINKLKYSVTIYVNIYHTDQTRLSYYEPIKTEQCIISNNSDLYNQYFSLENMDDNNVFAAAYYFINDVYYPNWKSDES